MTQPIKKVQLAIRAEAALAKVQLKQTMRTIGLLLLGGVFLLFALGALNYSAFEALKMQIGPSWAGLCVALGDLTIGGVLASMALSEPGKSDEQRLAEELREMTYSSLEEDVDALQKELRSFATDVRRIRSAVALVLGGVTGPLGLVTRVLSSLFEGGRGSGSTVDGDNTASSDDELGR